MQNICFQIVNLHILQQQVRFNVHINIISNSLFSLVIDFILFMFFLYISQRSIHRQSKSFQKIMITLTFNKEKKLFCHVWQVQLYLLVCSEDQKANPTPCLREPSKYLFMKFFNLKNKEIIA